MRNLRIFHNGKIATTSKPYFAEAIAVENVKVSSVGGNSDVLRPKKPDTDARPGMPCDVEEQFHHPAQPFALLWSRSRDALAELPFICTD
jgi:hypothetical protein